MVMAFRKVLPFHKVLPFRKITFRRFPKSRIHTTIEKHLLSISVNQERGAALLSLPRFLILKMD
jgi:hypothetical protein